MNDERSGEPDPVEPYDNPPIPPWAVEMADAFRKVDALLVPESGRRWHLEDGWWVTTIFHEFRFIDDYGFTFESVFLHQSGHYLVFRGPCHSLHFEYSSGGVCNGSLAGDGVVPPSTLDGLLYERGTGEGPPLMDYRDDKTVQARIRYWASGLERLAPSVLVCGPASDDSPRPRP